MAACDFFVVITAAFLNLTGTGLYDDEGALATSSAMLSRVDGRSGKDDRPSAIRGTAAASILRMPVRAPPANSVCERLGGGLRRDCLDFLIPFNEHHLRLTVRDWVIHYNRRRPRSALEPAA
jgi:hypothetical protein